MVARARLAQRPPTTVKTNSAQLQQKNTQVQQRHNPTTHKCRAVQPSSNHAQLEALPLLFYSQAAFIK
ncbi:MAG: hypothetical protein ACI4BI_05855 [Anaerotardibacter sp.]